MSGFVPPSPSSRCLSATARCILDRCASCGAPCMRDEDALVGFCDDCLEASDPRTYLGYPEDWVMLGGSE